MKLLPFALALQLAAAGQALAAPEQVSPDNNNCLWVRDIDHTSVVDSKTVLFHMRDHTVWKNTLPTACPALNFHGFVFHSNSERVCSGVTPITVLVTHEVCALGQFDPAGSQ